MSRLRRRMWLPALVKEGSEQRGFKLYEPILVAIRRVCSTGAHRRCSSAPARPSRRLAQSSACTGAGNGNAVLFLTLWRHQWVQEARERKRSRAPGAQVQAVLHEVVLPEEPREQPVQAPRTGRCSLRDGKVTYDVMNSVGEKICWFALVAAYAGW